MAIEGGSIHSDGEGWVLAAAVPCVPRPGTNALPPSPPHRHPSRAPLVFGQRPPGCPSLILRVSAGADADADAATGPPAPGGCSTLMVTEECLLDPSRNVGMTKADKEQMLKVRCRRAHAPGVQGRRRRRRRWRWRQWQGRGRGGWMPLRRTLLELVLELRDLLAAATGLPGHRQGHLAVEGHGW